jgi:hypothetical protein
VVAARVVAVAEEASKQKVRRLQGLMAAVLISLLATVVCAQSAASTRLMALVNAGDLDALDDDDLQRAAIDAGPIVIPTLQSFLSKEKDEDRRQLALGAALFIGGDSAISLFREEYKRTKDEDLKIVLAMALASSDTPESRSELIGMLSSARRDSAVTSAAALSLALLRDKTAVTKLRSLPQARREVDSENRQLALSWIEKGYWPVGSIPDDEKARAIAAVLRNGSPNIEESDYVVDEDAGGYWKYSTSGWTFNKGETPDNDSNEPSIESYLGADGSRALVKVDMRCGMRCGTGYQFVLKKENGNWRVQTILLLWIS